MRRVAPLVLTVAALASACADEDLEGPNAENPRSITVSRIGANAPSVTKPSVTPSAGAARVNALPRQARADALPMFFRVQVQPGDTVARVAERYGVNPEYVIWNNEGVLRDGELIGGATLDIPSANGILHRPQLGETLTDTAARYSVELRAILDHPANASIALPSMPPPSVILVPDGRMP